MRLFSSQSDQEQVNVDHGHLTKISRIFLHGCKLVFTLLECYKTEIMPLEDIYGHWTVLMGAEESVS